MKLKRKFFQNIYKKPNEFKNGKFFISYFLFLFFLNCIPDERPTYNSLLTSFFFTPKDQSIEFTNTSSTRISDSDEDLNVLSYNLFLYSKEDTYFGYWEEEERAELLAKSKFMKNQDVIVLEEAFDMNARNILLNNLALEYPDQTDVIGKTRDGWNQTLGDFRQNVNNGGVVVLSKWPIQEKIQYIFKNHGCGNDALYDKGFAYVKLKKEIG